MTRAGSLASSLLLVAVAIAATLLAGEAAVRLLGLEARVKVRVVPGKGITFEPSAPYRHVKEGFSSGRFNAQGFRDRERSVVKPPGGFRILVLGDSFVEAFQVPLDEAFPAVLEDRLRARPGGGTTEVLAMGQSGFGTASELMRYLDFGAAYAPDVVLLAFYAGNDVRDNSRRLSGDAPAFYFTLGADGALVPDRSRIEALERARAETGFMDWLQDQSQLAALVSDRLTLLRLARRAARQRRDAPASPARGGPSAAAPPPPALEDEENVYSEDAGPAWRQAWDVTEAILDRLARETAARGSRLAVVSIGTAEQVEEDLGKGVLARGAGRDLDRPDRRLEAMAAKRGIPCLLLAPGLRAAEASGSGHLYGFGGRRGGHWNAAGHRIAAGLIERFLDAQGLSGPGASSEAAASTGLAPEARAFTAPSSGR
jgi:lysophospholipase L1-like esterase